MPTTATPQLPTVHRPDPTAEARKADHINLALDSQVARAQADPRFDYEPLLAATPGNRPRPVSWLGKELSAPWWISSMTGGTAGAGQINRLLARACGEFGLGMGLGSCRALLLDGKHLPDFDVRAEMGDRGLLFANLGIAQVERTLAAGEAERIPAMLAQLRADGLIVHVNPLQEWLQPEGDRIEHPPLETLQRLLETADYPVIVKEVGQGFGPASLDALFRLPLAAVDFAAHGGTNFSRLEMLRSNESERAAYERVALLGHTAPEMVVTANRVLADLGAEARCQRVIVSGGIRDFLDGWWLIQNLDVPAVYAQGSAFLKPARESWEALAAFVDGQLRGLALAEAWLKVRRIDAGPVA
jgi:isopentenyl-diphosphate delta-isomerase